MFMIHRVSVPDYTKPRYQIVGTLYPMPDGTKQFARILGYDSKMVYELSWGTFDDKHELEQEFVIVVSEDPKQIKAAVNAIYSDVASQLEGFDQMIRDIDESYQD